MENKNQDARVNLSDAVERQDLPRTTATGDVPSMEKPCIHTVATGKHEWNAISHLRQAHDRFWIPRCETCGWIDTESLVREVNETRARQQDDNESPTARELHLFDVYESLGVKWGDDVFSAIARNRAAHAALVEALTVLVDAVERHAYYYEDKLSDQSDEMNAARAALALAEQKS